MSFQKSEHVERAVLEQSKKEHEFTEMKKQIKAMHEKMRAAES